jgi:nitroreductase / dihydropteridine reductase
MNSNPSTSQILQSLNWRYAVKSFDTNKKLTNDQLDFVKEAMRLSPSSYGIQAWKFVEIKSPKTRDSIQAIGWNQGQFTEASSLFAFCTYIDPIVKADKIVEEYIDQIVVQRGVTKESLKGYQDMMINAVKNGNTSGNPEYSEYWLDDQLYLALGQTMTACAIAGIDTCAMEGFDTTKANEILDLGKDGLRVKAFLAVGFRSDDDKYATIKKVRNPIDSLFIQR